MSAATALPRDLPLERDPGRIEAMFERIVPRYDLMNRLMTAGLDRGWREAAAREAAPRPGEPLLDACCGTGDLTLELQRRFPACPVTGLDLTPGMLEAARGKVGRATARPAGLAPDFIQGDLLDLPFDDSLFAAVTVGWGVRNVPDLPRAFSEMARVTRPGGRVICLEATQAPAGMGRRFHAVWFERVVPLLGTLVGGDRDAYRYLPASVRAFPDADGLAALMRDAGLLRVHYRRFGFGAMALHVGTVPS